MNSPYLRIPLSVPDRSSPACGCSRGRSDRRSRSGTGTRPAARGYPADSAPTFSGATAASSQPSHSSGAPGAVAAARGPASRIRHIARASAGVYSRTVGAGRQRFHPVDELSPRSDPPLRRSSNPNSTSRYPRPSGTRSRCGAPFRRRPRPSIPRTLRGRSDGTRRISGT